MDESQENRTLLRLDGSHGLGMNSHLTIITTDKVMGSKETTYEFPYTLIDFKILRESLDNNLILGFRIEKIIPADAKTVVLGIGPNGLYKAEED